jgi:type IV secretion system protein VirD4
MKRDSPKQVLILAAFGLIPVVWAALLAAPAVAGGLPDILQNLTAALNNPLKITWCGDSPKTILFFIAAYGMARCTAVPLRSDRISFSSWRKPSLWVQYI